MEARHQIHSRQFLYNPTEADWRKALHTIKYLLKTVNEGIRIDPWEDQGDIFTDAGEEKLEEKATTGILVKSGATQLLWSARKQDVTVLSSNKAEYIALGSGCQEGMWICKVLKSLQKPQIPTIYNNNRGAATLTQYPDVQSTYDGGITLRENALKKETCW